MNVLVIGANGTTGKMVVENLAENSQHLVKAMIRKIEQAEELEKLGARPIIADLEQDFEYAIEGINAIIFAAGSGGHTGPDKTISVDQEGAIKAIDFAVKQGIERFVMLSSMGADDPSKGSEEMKHYYMAKHNADEHLKLSGLNYTIVRPGALTDDHGTRAIEAAVSLNKRGEIPRADVAKVLVDSLLEENTFHKHFEILKGNTPLEVALKNV
jgi:uncharacterized protein YbjT (DUF2867 family)